MRTTRLFVVLVLAAGINAVSGTAGSAQDAVIYACANKTDGRLRLVPPPETCRATEVALSWATAGPQGPEGPAGPPGVEGPAGVVSTNATGAFDFTNLNGFVALGELNAGNLGETGSGTRLVWYPAKAAFRAGRAFGDRWDDVNIGLASTAMGYGVWARGETSTALGEFTDASGETSTALGFQATASGDFSTAIGNNTVASGNTSTAMGFTTTAGGNTSTAMGFQTTASGNYSTAMGVVTTASGEFSTAMGNNTEASGNFSTAMGRHASTNNQPGTFVYGDFSTSSNILATMPNQFVVRATGGTIFYSNQFLNAGVSLAPGGGAWASVSDVHMKTNFRDLDGETVLTKLAQIPIREWSYITQDAAIRHVGPTAQDFRAAFGLGDNDRTINTLDPDGISLKAIQALHARTDRLQEENAALRAELARLREVVEQLRR